MRGKVLGQRLRAVDSGITPAYAGKSSFPPRNSRMCKDHPRLCGDKGVKATSLYTEKGSPPPMRGKVGLTEEQVDSVGITPAYAGKSAPLPSSPSLPQDHPRLCGEKCHTNQFSS